MGSLASTGSPIQRGLCGDPGRMRVGIRRAPDFCISCKQVGQNNEQINEETSV